MTDHVDEMLALPLRLQSIFNPLCLVELLFFLVCDVNCPKGEYQA
jgi:hypothetical protein